MTAPKRISQTFLILLLFSLSMLTIVSVPRGSAQVGTDVSGIISSDTTWASTGSPYNLVGNILVNNGMTLTIGDGATLNLNGFYILVNGTLMVQQGVTINMGNASAYIKVNGVLSAKGASDNKIQINGNSAGVTVFGPFYYSSIIFTSASTGWNDQTSSGSIIENAIVNNTAIEVSSSVKITKDEINGGELDILAGSSLIYQNSISNLVYIKGGSCSLLCNQITDGFVLFSGGDTTRIANNIISHSKQVSGARDGIWFSGETFGSLVIENNLISDNTYGIQIFSPNVGNMPTVLTIRNNTITNNDVGIYVSNSYTPKIENNNIQNNNINVKLVTDYSGNSKDIDASNNWWGTTDQQTINASIYDFKNDFNLGIVTFTPFLTAENTEATPNLDATILTPTPPPTPSNTPTQSLTPSITPTIPEYSWLIIVPILLAAFSIAVVLKHQKTTKTKL